MRDELDRGVTLPSSPRSVGLARHHVKEACTAAGWMGPLDAAALLVSEVATNAVLHAYGPEIHVEVSATPHHLRVEVLDGSPDLPLPRRAGDGAENGRGLALVEALASGWGVTSTADGKTFWFTIEA